MKRILQPFYDQYYFMLQTACRIEKFSIATMGPQGTSSAYALAYLLENMLTFNRGMKRRECLFDTFDEVLRSVQAGEVSFALVPSAYEKITEFFWSERLNNCFNFLYPTPQYGLAAKSTCEITEGRRIVLATCPAVAHLAREFRAAELSGTRVEILLTPSTAKALEAVVEGKADMAITNETSIDRYKAEQVRFFSSKRRAHIVWCVFRTKVIEQRR